MADKNSGSVIEIVNSTACILAKKKLNFKETDKEDQGKLAMLSLKISEQQEEVQESIDGIYNTIKAQYFGILLPQGLKQEVAEYVFNQVNEKNLYSVSEIENGDATVKEILVSALQKTDKIEISQTTSDNNFGNLKILKNDSQKDNLILENKNLENKIASETFKKAHNDNATQSDKDLAVVMITLSELDAFIEFGLNYAQLDNPDKKTVINTIDVLKKTQPELAQNYMKLFGIDEKTFNEAERSNTKYILDTNSVEMDEVSRKIKNVGDRIAAFLKYKDNLSEEEKKQKFLDIKNVIDQSDYPIDGIVSGLLRGCNTNSEEPYFLQIMDILKDKFKEPKNILIDGYFTLEFMQFTQILLKEDSKLANELLESFNNCIKLEEDKLSIELIENIPQEAFNEIGDKKNSDALAQEGTYFVVNQVKQIQTMKKSSTVNSGIIPIGISPKLIIKDDSLQYRRGVEAFFKDKKKMIPKAIQVLTSKASGDKKDVFQEVIVERLLEEKDSPEINSPESMEQRKELFKLIIERAISTGNSVNHQLLDNLVKIDLNTVKKVLKEDLIPAQNDTPTTLRGQYVQSIGETVKDAQKKGFLNPARTSLGKIIENQGVLIENRNPNNTNQEFDEEQEL